MKRTLLLNAALSRVIASLGHGDMLVIGDAGLPIPPGPERIDLALSRGIPSFADVLAAVLSEMQVERAVIADEACLDKTTLPRWCAALAPVTPQTVPHAEFKRLCAGASAIVRTGEYTPYHNVLLVAGVVF